MHHSYVDIILETIVEQFENEENFYMEQLQLSQEAWEKWKKSQYQLSNEGMQKIKNLFTDYEWMLVQKVLRQTILFPEKRQSAVSEYKRVKTQIAKKWLQSTIGRAEIAPDVPKKEDKQQNNIHLKVILSYEDWGFDDIVTFTLPSKIQALLRGSKVELLEWVNENLTDVYVGE